MSSRTQTIPIINWKDYTSYKGYNPYWLEIKVLHADTFSTPAGICCDVLVDGKITILPLKARRHNANLLKAWKDNVASGRIKDGTEFMLKTWLEESEKSKIERRFVFQFGGR